LTSWCWAQPALELRVDASTAPRRLLRSQTTIPVQPGPMALVFPKWIPGEHGPSGPLNSVVELKVFAGLKPLPWVRDSQNLHRITLEVPAGIQQLRVEMTLGETSGSSQLRLLNFNQLLWHPEDIDAAEVQMQAEILLPPSWTGVSALQRKAISGPIRLSRVDLSTLVDSPMLIGQHLASWDVTPKGEIKPHQVHAAADRPEALKMNPAYLDYLRKLVVQTGHLFGYRPYSHYDWLLSLSDSLEPDGLEHHQSSDNRWSEDGLIDQVQRQQLGDLLAHEFVHVWNGKYRRPAGLLSPDYQAPMDTSLLWFYEGLTNFWGEVLPVRCGLMKPEFYREQLALTAARFDHQVGKNWRSLEDVSRSAQLLYEAPQAWSDLRRGVDFYAEGVILWLEIDALLRQKSGEKISLDDFCQQFFCMEAGYPRVKTYDDAEIYFLLDQLVRFDWKSHLEARVRARDGKAFGQALEAAGWRLVYNDQENQKMLQMEANSEGFQRMFSVGLNLGEKGQILDVREGSAASQAGLFPGMNLIAVNRHKFSARRLDDAIRQGKVELLVEHAGVYSDFRLEYQGGLRHPHLQRISTVPDRLSALLKAK